MCFLLQRGDASKEMLIIHQLIYTGEERPLPGGAEFAGEPEEVVV